MNETALCFLRQDNHLLLAHVESNTGKKLWTGLGGQVLAGETAEQAVVREVEEKTYMHLAVSKVTKSAQIKNESLTNIFITDYFTGEITPKDSTIRDLLWFPLNDLPYPFMKVGTREWLEPVLEGKFIKVINGVISEVSQFD